MSFASELRHCVKIFLIIGFFGVAVFSGVQETKQLQCMFSDRLYTIGDSWYHFVNNSKTPLCLICHCQEKGRISCTTSTCEENKCSYTVNSKESCCNKCITHEIEKPTIPQMSEGYLTCLDNGHIYKDGETFASTTTSLQPQQPNQCVQCVCQEGRILCRLKTCKLATCSKTISTPDDCCQVCQGAEDVNNKDIDSQDHVLVTFMITDESTKRRNSTNDCLSGGQIYPQGATWHPVIGPLGQMECVICKCQLGKVECSRLNCKETKSCNKLKQVPGRCCPVCISEEVSEDVTSSKEIPQQNPLSNETPEKLCIPKKRDALVYRSQASHRLSGYYQYAFQTQNDHGTVRLLSWTVKAATRRLSVLAISNLAV
ncbi:chordin-like protein 1 isoform X2 [Tachypleus tridentatus]|uniref:chordin-like protein 1 isoform X2 n=1 Tax=Tachypleus tridentatus TaxID=6853 RepID=UPI003FD5FEDC